MQSLRCSMLHYACCYALLPALFHAGKTLAAEPMQQVEPVSSELLCDWLRQKPASAATAPVSVVDDRKIRIGKIHIRTEPIFSQDADIML